MLTVSSLGKTVMDRAVISSYQIGIYPGLPEGSGYIRGPVNINQNPVKFKPDPVNFDPDPPHAPTRFLPF